jgi:hypothetical protein
MMMMLKNVATVVTLSAVVVAGSPRARAETTAERLVAAGVELRVKGDPAGALKLFEQAHALEPSALTLGQMGLAEQSLKRWEDSEGHLSSALERRDAAWVQKNNVPLEQALEAVSAHVGEIVLAGSPSGADVYVNGKGRGTLPLRGPIRVSEGEASIQVTAAGYQPYLGMVRVQGRGTAPVDVALEKQRLVEIPVKPVAEPWPAKRVAGASLFGSGVIAAGVGGVLLLFDKHGTCSADPSETCNRRTRTTFPGWSLIGTGAAAIVVGAVFLYNAPSEPVAVGVGPSSVLVGGRF